MHVGQIVFLILEGFAPSVNVPAGGFAHAVLPAIVTSVQPGPSYNIHSFGDEQVDPSGAMADRYSHQNVVEGDEPGNIRQYA